MGQPGTWAEGLQEGYLYQEPPDHYPDLITANGGTIVFECQRGEGRLAFHHAGTPAYHTIHPTFVFGAITDAQSTKTKAELMSYFMAHLAGDVVPPQPPPSLCASVVELPQGSRLRLTWSPVTQDVNGGPEIVQYYAVHRATTAHLVLTAGSRIGQTPRTEFLDRDAFTVGDPGTNYFYAVCAVDMGDNMSAGSIPAGEFDFGTE